MNDIINVHENNQKLLKSCTNIIITLSERIIWGLMLVAKFKHLADLIWGRKRPCTIIRFDNQFACSIEFSKDYTCTGWDIIKSPHLLS